MGLDWIAGARPAPGHEEAGWAALRRALQTRDPADMEAWHAIPVVDSWTVVGAPRVGEDREADHWLVRRMRGDGPDVPIGIIVPEERAALTRSAGLYVVDLAPPCDGVPVYSNAPLNRELEGTSFRGQFLEDTVDLIGEELWDRAHERLFPPELERFTRSLELLTAHWARTFGLEEVARRREAPEDDEGTPASKVHILASAARWCRYWVDRGHWLDAWS